MQLCVLASGSSGNCSVIRVGDDGQDLLLKIGRAHV